MVFGVHARGLNPYKIKDIIAGHLGRSAGSLEELLQDLDDNPETSGRIIVIDALDEARDARILLAGLLVPLACRRGLRLIIGVRRHVILPASDISLMIDLDSEAYRDPQALADYAYQLLVTANEPNLSSPYRELGNDIAMAVAAGIAEKATARLTETGRAESFLLAQLIARAVRRRQQVIDVTRPDWSDQLPADVSAAFEEDLLRLGKRKPTAQILLGALAWARGPGLPWENLWVPVARALADIVGGRDQPSVTDEDVRWLLAQGGVYIAEDIGPGGRSVYRPFHDLLAAHLRGESAGADAWEQQRTRAERIITGALVASVRVDAQGRRDWISAHPYLRTYLAQHAAAAGERTLAELVQDADFLAVADPVTLNPLLSPAITELSHVARVYRRARPLLGDDPCANATYLEEAEHTLTRTIGRSDGSNVRRLYRTHLALVRPDDSLVTFNGHTKPVMSVAFGTGSDGRLLLASGGQDETVRIWDPVAGAYVHTLIGHTAMVASVAFGTGPDGRLLLASGGWDETVRIWDPVAGAHVHTLIGHTAMVASVAFGTGPDGRLLLASGGWDETVRIWDPVAGTQSGTFTDHMATNRSVALGTGPDGRLLLAFSSSRVAVEVWDLVTRTHVRTIGHFAEVRSVAFGTGSDGRLLLAFASSFRVEIWDPVTGANVTTLTDTSISAPLLALGADQDGRILVATPTPLRRIRVWDPVTGADAGTVSGHLGQLTALAFVTGPDQLLLLASGSQDTTVRVWDPLNISAPAQDPAIGHRGWVTSVAFGTGPDGRLLLASGSADDAVRLWDPLTGSMLGGPFNAITYRVNSAAVATTRDGRITIAAAGGDNTVQLWDPIAGKLSRTLSGHTDSVESVAFGTTPGGQLLLASASHDETIRLWDPLTGRCIGKLTGHTRGPSYTIPTGQVTSVTFGTDPGESLLLASGSYDATVRLWNPLTRTPVAVLAGHSGWVHTVAFGVNADGALLLASGGDDNTVRLWDPIQGIPVGKPLTGHTRAVTSVAFGTFADGRPLLASGSTDRTVRLWDPAARTCVAILRRRSIVLSVAMSGPLLAIGDNEGFCVIEPQV